MSARTIAVLALAVSIGVAAPWIAHEPVAAAVPMDVASFDGNDLPHANDIPLAGMHAAVNAAVQTHVPGVSGNDWALHRLEHSDPDAEGVRRVVAQGIIATPGAPDTAIHLTGRYDPATGELTKLTYRLRPSVVPVSASLDTGATGPATTWSVELAVQQALSESLPGQEVRFALDSAQATRVPGGGRRFEGFGIGSWGDGQARFVAFTLVLSDDGQPVRFDYGTEADDVGQSEPAMIAGY